jgi:hypothetical protein
METCRRHTEAALLASAHIKRGREVFGAQVPPPPRLDERKHELRCDAEIGERDGTESAINKTQKRRQLQS